MNKFSGTYTQNLNQALRGEIDKHAKAGWYSNKHTRKLLKFAKYLSRSIHGN